MLARNLIPFAPPAPAKLRRCVTGLVSAFAADRITRQQLNDHLADILPAGVWIDCRAFRIQLVIMPDGEPYSVFRPGIKSVDGRCPICHGTDRYLQGAGKNRVFWCKKCQFAYGVEK